MNDKEITALDRILDEIERMDDFLHTLHEIWELPEIPSCEPWRWER